MRQDMRFGVIRDKKATNEEQYTLDGEYCPSCHLPTEVGADHQRRHCTNRKCNAMILEEP